MLLPQPPSSPIPEDGRNPMALERGPPAARLALPLALPLPLPDTLVKADLQRGEEEIRDPVDADAAEHDGHGAPLAMDL